MRGIIVVIVLLVVVFFGVPLVAEGTTNSCQALEKHSVSNAASSIAGGTSGPIYNTVNSVGQAGATGQVASTMMSQDHPNSPTPVSCTYYYWKDLI
jgi:hypothetical protein